jgi:hypothetical protein
MTLPKPPFVPRVCQVVSHVRAILGVICDSPGLRAELDAYTDFVLRPMSDCGRLGASVETLSPVVGARRRQVRVGTDVRQGVVVPVLAAPPSRTFPADASASS